ncbi:hypothetical protein ACFY3B_19320 [Micromonospora parva]|uniref:FdhE protein n=1 Tax=Micromonospora parva TaxID=1464048 RepID=A0ABW6W066_9ACTN
MTPTLALERMMLHPQYDQIIQRARTLAPTAVVDQADAAATEAHRILSTAAVRFAEAPAYPATVADVPGWLRLGLLDTLAAFADGRATTCLHQPQAHRPSPVLAAAWLPGLVTCPGCAHLLSLQRNPDADATCDSCGHRCAGPEHGDGIYPGMVQLGPLIFHYGTCGDCRPPVASNNPLSATLPAQNAAPRGTGRVKPRGKRGRRRGRGGR